MTDFLITGNVPGIILNSGDTAGVISGGTASGTTVNSGGTLNLVGTASGAVILDAGSKTVQSTGIALKRIVIRKRSRPYHPCRYARETSTMKVDTGVDSACRRVVSLWRHRRNGVSVASVPGIVAPELPIS